MEEQTFEKIRWTSVARVAVLLVRRHYALLVRLECSMVLMDCCCCILMTMQKMNNTADEKKAKRGMMMMIRNSRPLLHLEILLVQSTIELLDKD